MKAKTLGVAVFAGLAITGCGSLTQYHRDSLHYRNVIRGTERYTITTARDSLEAMREIANANAEFNRDYVELNVWRRNAEKVQMADRPPQPPDEAGNVLLSSTPDLTIWRKDVMPKTFSLDGLVRSDQNPKARPPQVDGGSYGQGQGARTWVSDFWPESLWRGTKTVIVEDQEKKTTTTTTTTELPSESMVRALSSTASALHMRDLITEPSFPNLIPTERTIQLGCVPPSDNVVFEALSQIQATAAKEQKVTGPGDESADSSVSAEISGEARTTAFKVVEETQKTWFLQWALYRLCEASLNSNANFRNVMPVVIHDIVRRSAEMSNEAEQAIATRVVEQEKTRQEQERTLQARMNKERDERVKQLELDIEATKLKTEQARKDVVSQETVLAQTKKALADAEVATAKEQRVTRCFDEQLKKEPKPDPKDVKTLCEQAR